MHISTNMLSTKGTFYGIDTERSKEKGVVLAFLLAWLLGKGWLFILFVTFGTYLALGGWNFIRLVVLTLPRDL